MTAGTAVPFLAHVIGAAAEKLAEFFLTKKRTLLRPRNLFWLALVVAGLASSAAPSQSTPPPASAPAEYGFSSPGALISQISNQVTTQLTALQNSSALQGFGRYITAFFLVALMVWAAVRMLASGRGFGELLGEWVPIFISFGIVTLFLDKSAANLIVATMDSIGAAIGGAEMATLESAIRAGGEPIFKSIAAVVDQPRVTGSSEGGFLETIAAGAASMIMGAIAKVVTAFILVLAGVVMVAMIIMGFISVALVLALAPVMVPFLMFRPLSWLFDGWLKFLLGACMLKIVVAFLLKVVAGLLSAMSAMAVAHNTSMQGAAPLETLYVDILLFGMMLIFALLSMLLLMQAPGIATGLLSGSAGSIGFSGMRGITQSPTGRGIHWAGAGAGKWAGKGLQSGTKAGFAAMVGAAHGKGMRGMDSVERTGMAKAAYAGAYRRTANKTQGPVLPRNVVPVGKK